MLSTMGVLEMEKELIEKMKQALVDLKTEIINQLMANSNDFRQIVESMEAKDVVDIASDDIDRRMLDAVGTKDLNRLKLIDSALTRIEQGKYGLCMKCGKRIHKERLKTIPYALLCVHCKSADEKRSRG